MKLRTFQVIYIKIKFLELEQHISLVMICSSKQHLDLILKILHQSFFFNIGASYRLDFHKDVDPEVKLEEKLMKKEERMYMKGAKKAQKADKKRNKKARKKPKND